MQSTPEVEPSHSNTSQEQKFSIMNSHPGSSGKDGQGFTRRRCFPDVLNSTTENESSDKKSSVSAKATGFSRPESRRPFVRVSYANNNPSRLLRYAGGGMYTCKTCENIWLFGLAGGRGLYLKSLYMETIPVRHFGYGGRGLYTVYDHEEYEPSVSEPSDEAELRTDGPSNMPKYSESDQSQEPQQPELQNMRATLSQAIPSSPDLMEVDSESDEKCPDSIPEVPEDEDMEEPRHAQGCIQCSQFPF